MRGDGQKEVGRVPSKPGSREPSPEGLGPTGFDPSRAEWHYMYGDTPQLRDNEVIYALGRYNDVYGPLPFALFHPEAWGGNMFCASHDLVAFSLCADSTASYWRDPQWLSGDGAARLKEAVGSIVSMCADGRDVFPDYQTSFEAVTEAVNELYGCVEDGVFTSDSDGCASAARPGTGLDPKDDSAGPQDIAKPLSETS